MEKKICPECGRELTYHEPPPGLGLKGGYATCPCVLERKEKERQEKIQRGTLLARERYRMQSGIKPRQLNARLELFQPREGQQAAHTACVELASAFANGEKPQGLILSGSVGSGKTYLAAALCNSIIDHYPVDDWTAQWNYDERLNDIRSPYEAKSPVVFYTVVDLYNAIKATFQRDSKVTTDSVLERCKLAKLLVLDDLAAEKPSEAMEEYLYSIINSRYDHMLPMVITTNATPKELKERIGARSFDRIREDCKYITLASKSQRKTAGGSNE